MGRIGLAKELYESKEIKEFIFKEYLSGKSFVTIAKENNWPMNTVRLIYKDNGGRVRTDREQALKFTCNDDYFEIIDTPEKAYWLGFMYSDGFIQAKRKYNTTRVGITLTKSDEGHLEKFKEAVKFTGPIHSYDPDKKYSYEGSKRFSRILISSPKMADDLIKNGCVTQKSNILKYPDETILPKELESHFIRGLIDGDGSIIRYNEPNNKHSYGISLTGTESICTNVLHFFGKDNIKLQKRHKKRKTNNYSFTIGGNKQVKKFLDILYKDATVYLDRKYERYLEVLELSRAWK